MEEELLPNGEHSFLLRRKTYHVLLKVLVSSLLMGLFCCVLFFTGLFALSSAGKSEVPVLMRSRAGQCNLTSGKWIWNPSGPAYTNDTCRFIVDHFNCMRNGRPDTMYLYWRWKPYGCGLPPFNPEKFMKAMRDKSWAFIGDSILLNHIQSLLCLLSKVEEPVMVYHDEGFKCGTWYFSSYNFTLAIIWAPFLIKYGTYDNIKGSTTAAYQIHLDILDEKWTSQYHKYDYIVISGGQWFLQSAVFWDNGMVIGCHNCGDNIQEIGVAIPYRKALELAFRFIVTSDHKPHVIFRTWSLHHFSSGDWNTQGICNRTLPYKEGEYDGTYTDHAMHDVEIEEFEKAAAIGSKNGARMNMLDIFHLSLLRPDGHPGPYKYLHPFRKDKNAKVENDCLHWCVPGSLESWNDIMMEMLLNDADWKYSS